MVVESTRLGQLDISEEEILKFPKGLPGFPNETAFAYIPYGPDSPLVFLQSIGEPNLTFLIVEPFTFFSDYQFELDDTYTQDLGLSGESLVEVYNIVSVPEKAEEMTANLLAPIVVNWQTRTAMQIVLEKSAYTTRHRLFPQGFPKKTTEGGK